MNVRRHWRVRFAWYDLWLGVFWDRRQRILYICPLPCLLIETWRQDDNPAYSGRATERGEGEGG